MSEFIQHRYSKALRDLFLYCPKTYAESAWDESRIGFWSWQERDLLYRCYAEKGFIEKLEKYVESLKSQTEKPRLEQKVVRSPWRKYRNHEAEALFEKEPETAKCA